MRVRIHPKHGVMIEDVDDQRIELHFFSDGNVTVDINGPDDGDEDDDEPKLAPYPGRFAVGRN